MTREEILLRTKELYMRYGIRSVTMDDVASQLGISKKTLYQHVRNKEDLIKGIVEHHIAHETHCISAIGEQAEDPVEQLILIARHVVKLLRSMSPITMFDLKKYHNEYFRMIDAFHLEHVYHTIRHNLMEGIEQGYYRDNMDPDIIAKLYVGKTMFLTDEEMFPLEQYDRDELFVQYINYHMRGILSDKGIEKLRTYQPIV